MHYPLHNDYVLQKKAQNNIIKLVLMTCVLFHKSSEAEHTFIHKVGW